MKSLAADWLTSIHIELFVHIYILARKIQALVKVQNSDRMNDLVLLTLVRTKAVSVTTLAGLLAIKPSAASDKVKRLEAEGLLKQLKGSDGREKMVILTTKGKKYIQTLIAAVHRRCLTTCSKPLPQKEAKIALEILRKIGVNTV